MNNSLALPRLEYLFHQASKPKRATAIASQQADTTELKIIISIVLLAFDRKDGLRYLQEKLKKDATTITDDSGHTTQIQTFVIKTLGQVPSVQGTQLLLTLLDEQTITTDAQLAILEALKNAYVQQQALSKLYSLYASNNTHVGKAALKTISHVETNKTKLLSLIENKAHPYPIRLQALSTLATTHKKAAIPDMLRLLKKYEDSYEDKIWQLFDDMQAKQIQPLLEEKLQIISQAYQQWRNQHATEELAVAENKYKKQDFTSKKWQQNLINNKPESPFQYAHALARIDAQRGIELLDNELAEIRQGAWRGLATLGDVELVKQMTKLRLKSHNKPLLHHALFRAIDLSLINIQVNAKQADLDALSAWFPTLKRLEDEEDGESPITQRADWTLGLLRYHLQVAMPELERRYQVWLKKQKKPTD